jgi:hypothetical protein
MVSHVSPGRVQVVRVQVVRQKWWLLEGQNNSTRDRGKEGSVIEGRRKGRFGGRPEDTGPRLRHVKQGRGAHGGQNGEKRGMKERSTSGRMGGRFL